MSEDTVHLRWPRESVFTDNQEDARYDGPGVFEVPARLEAFYRTRGWEDPPEDHDGEAEQPSSAINPNQTGPTRDELEGADPDEVTDDGDDAGGSGN